MLYYAKVVTTFCVYVHMGLGNVLGDWKVFDDL